jgi:hypothetical protein
LAFFRLSPAESPVVTCPTSFFINVDVLWVVEVSVGRVLDLIDYSWFEVNEQGSWDVVLIIGLVEEDILAIIALDGVLFKDSFVVDAMLFDKLLPELHADLVSTLADLKRNNLTRHLNILKEIFLF